MKFVMSLVAATILGTSSACVALNLSQLFRVSLVAIGAIDVACHQEFYLRSIQEETTTTSNQANQNQENQAHKITSTKKFFDALINKNNIEFVRAERKRYLKFTNDSSAELYLNNYAYNLRLNCNGLGNIQFFVNGTELLNESCQGILEVRLPANSTLSLESAVENEQSILQIDNVELSVIDPFTVPEPDSEPESWQSVLELNSTKGFFDKLRNKRNIEYIQEGKQRFLGFGLNGSANLRLHEHPHEFKCDCSGAGELMFVVKGKKIIKICEQNMLIEIPADAKRIRIKSLVENLDEVLLLDNIKLIGHSNHPKKGNFQVWVGGEWRGICCHGIDEFPVITEQGCLWEESARVIKDLTGGLYLHCPEQEGEAADCTCNDEKGENMHGAPGNSVDTSLDRIDEDGNLVGAPIFPNDGRETCVYVWQEDGDKVLKTRVTVGGNRWKEATGWPDDDCPAFRLLR